MATACMAINPGRGRNLPTFMASSGQQSQARYALQKLLEWDQRKPVDPAAVAWAYLGVGDKDQAFAYLEKAYVQHSAKLATLKVEPGFDPLRADPRYQDLLRRVRLAE